VTGTANVVRTYRAADGQTSTLSFASLTYTPGALQFYGEGLGLSDGRNKILIGGSVPLSGGIIGGNASYFDGTTTGSAGYSLANGVVLYAPASSIDVRGGVIPDLYTSVGITEAGSGGNMTLSAPVVTIQSLVQNALSAGTLELEGGTLRVGSVLIGSVSAPLTVGLVPGDGFLMADTNGGILSLNNNYATPLLVNAVIANHGSASSLLKTGGATVQLAAAATYTGATVISTGTLALVGSGALSDSTAVNLSDSSSVFDISSISGAGTEVGTLAGVAGSAVILGGKTLTTAADGTTSYNGVIGGTGGSLAKYGDGTLTLNGDNTFTGAVTVGGGALILNGNNAFAGTLTIGTGSKLVVPVILQSGVQPLGVGTSAIVFGGNADFGSELEYSGAASAILERGIHMSPGLGGAVNVSNASGVLTLTGELSGTSDFHKAGAGTMVISGGESWSGNGIVQEGTLIVGGAVSPGGNSISAGNWDITTGATLRINTTGAFEASSITRDGGLQLESGTLRTNALAGNGSFTWGNATLATLGNTTTGTVDRTDPAGSPSGPVVREGNILVYAGGLTTGGTSGAGSLLDLGSVLLNDGLRYNQISIGGSLDLSGVDTLNFSVNPYFLRPNTPDSVYTGDWGSLILVRATGFTGVFDSITGIGNDSIGWRAFTPGQNGDLAFTGAIDLPMNTYYIEYATNSPDGAGVLAGPAILFHYKVAGSVPEPSSVGLMIGGAFLLRQLRRRRP
jgi:fibronectin-binding autotransporter adhesin